MIASREVHGGYRAPSLAELQTFVYREVRLIDDRRWQDWAALFVPEGEYWVPAAASPRDPRTEVSLAYERDLLRALRIARYADAEAPSLDPPGRGSHLVGNVILEEFDPATGVCRVHARFIVAECRRDELTFHAGEYAYVLQPGDDGHYRMRSKTVLLVDRDGPLGDISYYL